VDFVEICNIYVGTMIIKAAKRIFNSDKICRSYSDLNFGVTFFGTQCIYTDVFTAYLTVEMNREDIDRKRIPVHWYIVDSFTYDSTTQYNTKCQCQCSLAAPRLWNSLPSKIRQCDSLREFKRLLKTHLFRDRGNLCDILVKSAV